MVTAHRITGDTKAAKHCLADGRSLLPAVSSAVQASMLALQRDS